MKPLVLAAIELLCFLSSSLGIGMRSEELQELIDSAEISPFALEIADFANLTTPEIIEAWGYPVEIHHVITEDGYILELHRIPFGIDGPSDSPRPVAYVQHGIFCSSSDWVMDKPDRALAYLLADAGYDVWLGNFRGNTYSRNHTTLDPDGIDFWQFSWDEMGMFDLPASIDYVLDATDSSQIYYVGFSMGTTTFFVLMSEHPEYSDKIVAAALLPPVAYLTYMKGGMRYFANSSDALDEFLTENEHGEIFHSGPRMDYLAQTKCTVDAPTLPTCYALLFMMNGFDPEELNPEYLSVILSHSPSGTSIHTLNHMEQLVYVGEFRKYDFGPDENLIRYGQDTPPLYNLQGDTPPLAFYYGDNDWLAQPGDVLRLASELKNVELVHRVEWALWNHNDFIWGIHAKELLYDYVLDFLSKH